VAAELAHTVAMTTAMTIFKCPHCSAQYEMIMTHISFRQRSYATCQVCWKAMYSWASTRVPRFTLLVQPDNTPAHN
jgi:transcription elongation factor Elf1